MTVIIMTFGTVIFVFTNLVPPWLMKEEPFKGNKYAKQKIRKVATTTLVSLESVND